MSEAQAQTHIPPVLSVPINFISWRYVRHTDPGSPRAPPNSSVGSCCPKAEEKLTITGCKRITLLTKEGVTA